MFDGVSISIDKPRTFAIGVSVNETFCAQVLLRFHKLRVNFGFLQLNNKKFGKLSV